MTGIAGRAPLKIEASIYGQGVILFTSTLQPFISQVKGRAAIACFSHAVLSTAGEKDSVCSAGSSECDEVF
jgi:hypothetical protein